jgi:Putative 2/3 transmembrane domain holin
MLPSLSFLLPKKKCPPNRQLLTSSSCRQMNCFLILAIVLVLVMAAIAPQQLSVLLNRILNLSVAAWAGYMLSRSMAPYARPGPLLDLIDATNRNGPPLTDWDLMIAKLAMSSMLARALVISSCIIGISLGI